MRKCTVFLMLLVLGSLCFPQVKKDEDRTAVTLCWNSSLDTSARYLVYFSRYNSGDTTWRLIGTTKDKSYTVAKETFKGDIAFGVKVVYYQDTSLMHTSLESTACANPSIDCDSTCATGPWYLSWHIRKPDHIQYKK
jgi:hypothetical protein